MTAPAAIDCDRFAYGNNHTGNGKMSHYKVFNPDRFRAQFPDHWSSFLKSNFRNPEHVAFVFDVTYQTARNWWEGTHKPSGDFVAWAASEMPRRFAAAMGYAA